jgi:hypothetical protein
MTNPEVFVTQVAISNATSEQNLCFGEGTTYVRLQDDAGGYFLEIVQNANEFNGDKDQIIRLDFKDIGALHKAMIKLKSEAERWEKLNEGAQDGF